jgi:hypothetical protein
VTFTSASSAPSDANKNISFAQLTQQLSDMHALTGNRDITMVLNHIPTIPQTLFIRASSREILCAKFPVAVPLVDPILHMTTSMMLVTTWAGAIIRLNKEHCNCGSVQPSLSTFSPQLICRAAARQSLTVPFPLPSLSRSHY